jgi:hypothetical protein
MDYIVISKFLAVSICLFISLIGFGIQFNLLTFDPKWSYDVDDFCDDGKILLGLDDDSDTRHTVSVSAKKPIKKKVAKKKVAKKKPVKKKHVEKKVVKHKPTKHKPTKNRVAKRTVVKKKKPKKSIELSPLQNDCILALTSLGVKKSTAKTDVKSFFNNNNITTVEDFLQKYMKEQANVKNV